MKKMTSVKVRLYTYRATKSETYPLVFQILYKRKKRVVYSPYHLQKECFDEKQGLVVNRRKKKVYNIEEINEYIHSMIRELNTTIELLEEQEKDYSVSDIAELYRSNVDNSQVFVYMRKLMVQLKEEKRMGTLNIYQSTFNRVVGFVGGKKDLYFGDITAGWLNRFIGSLQKAGLKENTVNLYCRVLRAVYNRAYNEDIAGTNGNSPFRKVSFSSIKTAKRAIDSKSIKQIAHAKVEYSPQLEMARDLFMFSFYSRGMSFVDMACLKHTDIIGEVIYYTRKKTDQPLRVRIVPQMKVIIEKYRNMGEYVLPILRHSNKSLYSQYRNELRKFNNRLRQLSSRLKLERPLTSYVARHSWATLARKSGAPVSVISESLGHCSEKVTYTYLTSLDSSVIDSVNNKIAYLYA